MSTEIDWTDSLTSQANGCLSLERKGSIYKILDPTKYLTLYIYTAMNSKKYIDKYLVCREELFVIISGRLL
uniref:Uncharacterized protein n=1 Tax=Megaselia scalaris TaxID=36166 RepID=T1GQE5_MEGSC